MDEGDIIVQVEKLPSITLDQSSRLDKRIQKAILEHVPEVTRIVARVGADEIGLDPMGLNETDTFLILKPREEWRKPDKEWLIGEIPIVVEGFPVFLFYMCLRSDAVDVVYGTPVGFAKLNVPYMQHILPPEGWNG